MTLTHPAYVAPALLAVLAFALLYAAALRMRAGQAVAYSHLPFLIGSTAASAWPQRVLAAALVFAVGLVAFALAGPRVRTLVPVGGSVILCVDTSGSMNAADVAPTRAQAALAAMRPFIDRAPAQTAIGIVSFATDAQVLVRPTRDREQIAAALDAIPPPNGGTAIGDALALAKRVLPAQGPRAVVLITDGENNAGSDPMEAARTLGAARIPVYTVGIGTNSGALIPGTLQEAGINEDALRAYAGATGGAYSRADDAAQLREALARLGRTASFVRANVDVSLATAVCGGTLLAVTLLAAAMAGRFP